MINVNFDSIPQPHRESLRGFVSLLGELAGENLLAVSAFSGTAAGDPLYREVPVQTVVVLETMDLRLLNRLAVHGLRFGKQRVAAPLVMTPKYIQASCDTFPLELLEIQQSQLRIGGADHFGPLRFDRRDVRLECEHEFKSELIQLRQGLLTAAGRAKPLRAVCLNVAERTVRILRGVLYLTEAEPAPRLAAAVAGRVAELTKLPLDTLTFLLETETLIDFTVFARLYAEVEALAGYMNALVDGK